MTVPADRAQALDPGVLVSLFRLDARPAGGDVYHFTPGAGRVVTFGGQAYAPVDIEADGFETAAAGGLPTPTLRITNVGRVLAALVATAGDLLGSTVVRLRTFAAHLDDGSDADPTMHFPPDVYVVERLVRMDRAVIEWQLAAALDQEGRRLPGRQILQSACTHRYRLWAGGGWDYTAATCPYTGAAGFAASGDPVADPSMDRCGKRLSDCRRRFGAHGTLPTRAFPGVAKTRL